MYTEFMQSSIILLSAVTQNGDTTPVCSIVSGLVPYLVCISKQMLVFQFHAPETTSQTYFCKKRKGLMSCVQGHSYKPHTVCTYYFYHSLSHDPLFLLGGPGNKTRVENKNATLLILKTIHKCIHKMGPTYLHEKFIKPSDMGNSRTRGASKLYLHRPRTEFIRTLLNTQVLSYGTPYLLQ